MRESRTGNSFREAVEDAYSEVADLADSMRAAFEGTPEQFRGNSGRGREVAADILAAVLQPSVPSELSTKDHHIEWIEKSAGKDGKLSRPAKRDNVVRCLEAALHYVSNADDEKVNFSNFSRDLEIDIHNLKTIDFPGMRGR